MPTVQMPDGTRVRFPDDMPKEQIRDMIATKFPDAVNGAPRPESDYGQGWFAQNTSGLNEGLANTLGFPIDMANAAIGLGMKGVNAVAGTDFQPSAEPLGGSAGLKRSMEGIGSIYPESDEMGKRISRRAFQSVGASALPGAGVVANAQKPARALSQLLASSITGGASAGVAREAFPDNPYAEMAAELLGSAVATGVGAMLAKRTDRKAAEAAIPSTDDLRGLASSKYDDAERLGVTASRDQTQGLAANMRKTAEAEGLVSPTGRISEAYPKAREAIRMLDDYSNGTMSVPQMKSVRKVLSDAAGSADGSERRIATIMLKQFDDFTAPLAPQIAEGNALYTRAMRGSDLETLGDLASARAGQFTGSGYENALRTEYRGLERKIIKGQERGWSPAEQEAITRVAQGTTGSNIARNIGRAAPTGPVSFGGSVGIPFMIGNAIGGPGLGAALATGAAGAGYGARGLATKMGTRNAELAELLARSGGPVDTAMRDPESLRRLIAALVTGQAANLPN